MSRLTLGILMLLGCSVTFFQGCGKTCAPGKTDCTCGTVTKKVCDKGKVCFEVDGAGFCYKPCAKNGETNCACGRLTQKACTGQQKCEHNENRGRCTDDEVYEVRLTVGTAINLAKRSLVEADISGGRRFLNANNCIQEAKANGMEMRVNQMDTKADVLKQLTVNVGLKASMVDESGGVATATATSQFGETFNSHKYVKAVTFDKKNILQVYTLRTECNDKKEVQADVIKEFNELPEIPSFNEYSEWLAAWRKYESFVNKVGSHYIKKVFIGARVQYWIMDVSNTENKDKDIKASACVNYHDVANTTNLEFCAGVDYKNHSSNATNTLQTKIIAQGGNGADRIGLSGNSANTDIDNFLAQSEPKSAVQVQVEHVSSVLQEVNNTKATLLKKFTRSIMDTLDMPLCEKDSKTEAKKCRCSAEVMLQNGGACFPGSNWTDSFSKCEKTTTFWYIIGTYYFSCGEDQYSVVLESNLYCCEGKKTVPQLTRNAL